MHLRPRGVRSSWTIPWAQELGRALPTSLRQDQGRLAAFGAAPLEVGGLNEAEGTPELRARFNLFLFSFDCSVGNRKSMCMNFEECNLENSII